MPDQIKEIPLRDIFSDSSWNCRGAISVISVKELSRDIERHGLLSPIIIQPYSDKTTNFRYKIVTGHRRYLACRLLKLETIKCIIYENLTEEKAKIINLKENIERANLNILQEARAIKHYKTNGLKIDEIAKELNVSRMWVDVRLKLLDLEEDIQTQASAGLLTQQQIMALHKLPTPKRIEAARIIKDARLRGEKAADIVKNRKKINPTKIGKRRDEQETLKMIDHLLDQLGQCLASRCLAWVNGEISDYDLFLDIKKECEKEGKLYSIPNEFKGYIVV